MWQFLIVSFNFRLAESLDTVDVDYGINMLCDPADYAESKVITVPVGGFWIQGLAEVVLL